MDRTGDGPCSHPPARGEGRAAGRRRTLIRWWSSRSQPSRCRADGKLRRRDATTRRRDGIGVIARPLRLLGPRFARRPRHGSALQMPADRDSHLFTLPFPRKGGCPSSRSTAACDPLRHRRPEGRRPSGARALVVGYTAWTRRSSALLQSRSWERPLDTNVGCPPELPPGRVVASSRERASAASWTSEHTPDVIFRHTASRLTRMTPHTSGSGVAKTGGFTPLTGAFILVVGFD